MRVSSFCQLGFTLALAWGITGCSADAAGEASEENVDSSESFLLQDPSGTVTVKVKICPFSSTAGASRTATCSVDSGFVLVGGGAEIENDASPGALLTASTPLNKTTWFAASKDHNLSNPHKLRAFSIGLQLAGVSTTNLVNSVHITRATSSAGGGVRSVNVGFSSNFPNDILVGGGAETSCTSGSGELLVGSAPSSGLLTWGARSKDHVVACPSGQVTATVISIDRSPLGFGGTLVSQLQTVTGPSVPIGYGTAEWLPTGAATSIGGWANGSQRLLTDIVPLEQIFTVRTKDHQVANAGTTAVFGVTLRRL